MTARQTILVAGATGQQGGAVARHLRKNGFEVRALTRDPESDKARALREGGAERQSGVPHFDTKWQIEGHLRALDLPLTIVRPVHFFENFGGWGLQPQEGSDGYTFAMPLSPDTALQSVAVEDIGAFVAKAFAAPADGPPGSSSWPATTFPWPGTPRPSAATSARPWAPSRSPGRR